MTIATTISKYYCSPAGEAGIISVYAAGNASLDNDRAPIQQNGNSNPYALMVGALNSVNAAAFFSQVGERSVDVFSPGTRVLAATTTYSAKHGTDAGMAAQYTPWLEGSASRSSAYFIDDAATTSRSDGITYDLVSYEVTKDADGNYIPSSFVKSYGSPTLGSPGYFDGAENNNQSYRFDFPSTNTLTDTQKLAVRVTIPGETWEAIRGQDKGDDLYIAAIGSITGFDTDGEVTMSPCVHLADGWEFGESYLHSRDGTWYNSSTRQSVEEIDAGRDVDSGDVTIVYLLDAAADTLTGDQSIYLDNFSLGWAACTGFGTDNANGTYYYSDGTSMATPNTVGVVSLLCSQAKVASGQSDYSQDAATAKEIVSFVKGGVTQNDALSDKCKTGGVANAESSYSAYKAYKSAGDKEAALAATSSLKPVPESITDNGDGTLTLAGSFFGATKGYVIFDGERLAVTEWSDTAITFESLSLDKETIGKVVVNKSGDISGQSYLTMPADSKSTSAFSSLPLPDFDITYTDVTRGVATKITFSAGNVTPLKMAAAAGWVYVFGRTVLDEVPVLMRYCVATNTWDDKNYLADYAGKIFPYDNWLNASMVAGSSEIYLKVIAPDDKDEDTLLFTIDAATGDVRSSVQLDKDEENSCGSLGLYGDKLYEVGGSAGDPVCSAIYPDTGEVYWSSFEKLGKNVYYGSVTNNGRGLSITGSFNKSAAEAFGGNTYEPGTRNQEMDLAFGADGSTTLTESPFVFFPEADEASACGLNDGQGFSTIAVAAVDGGVIMTGPVRDNETADMVDTWIYRTSTKAWEGVTAARFAPAVEASACACTYNGTYFTMAQDMQGSNTYLRFASLPLEKLGLSDAAVAPTSDALTFVKANGVGDVNDNGTINVVDAQIVFDMAAGAWTEVEGEPFGKLIAALKARGTDWTLEKLTIVADANRDGEVASDDARAIQHYAHCGAFEVVA